MINAILRISKAPTVASFNSSIASSINSFIGTVIVPYSFKDCKDSKYNVK